MSDNAYFLLSLSILAPFGIGITRMRHLQAEFMPVLILLGVGVLEELGSRFLFRDGNAVSENIYFLLEAVLYCWMFRRWGHVLRSRTAYYCVIGGLLSLWGIDNFILHHIDAFHPMFEVVYSLGLVFFAVDEMNWLIVNEHGQIIANARFIICISLILYFAYKASAELFYYYTEDIDVRDHIFTIGAFLNLVFNILLSLALLCVPRKIGFTSLS